jgi:DDE_Tnp_1-associated
MPAASSSPVDPVFCHLFAAGDRLDGDRATVLPVLAAVADPRARRGVRHRLAVILALAVCAVLAGARSSTAIAERAADTDEATRAGLGIGGAVPCESTIRRTLQRLDADAFDHLAGARAQQRTAPSAGRRRVVAVDGKTLRGSATGTRPGRHLLAALDHDPRRGPGPGRCRGEDERDPDAARAPGQDQPPWCHRDRRCDACSARARPLPGGSARRALHPDREGQPAEAARPARGPALARRPGHSRHPRARSRPARAAHPQGHRRGRRAALPAAGYSPAWATKSSATPTASPPACPTRSRPDSSDRPPSSRSSSFPEQPMTGSDQFASPATSSGPTRFVSWTSGRRACSHGPSDGTGQSGCPGRGVAAGGVGNNS